MDIRNRILINRGEVGVSRRAVLETLAKLHEYDFKVIGLDVNKLVYRRVVFDTALGIVTVGRKEPFSKIKIERRFKF